MRQTTTVKIEKISHELRGIATHEGKVTFVDGALPGETVTVQFVRKKGKMNEARVVDVLEPSADRIEPKCAVYGTCGGCALQHMPPEMQLREKQNVLKEQFLHFAGVEPQTWLDPLQAGTWGYRSKARLGVKYVPKKGGALVGFREKDGRYLTDMHACEVLDPKVGHKIDALREWIGTLSIRDQIPQFEVAISEAETALIIRHLKPFTDEDLNGIKQFAENAQFKIYLQSKGPNTIKLFYPENANALMSYTLPKFDLTMQFAPSDFTQVNMALNEKMLDQALALLDPKGDEKVLDLFCGLGNFTLPVAKHASEVVGVEGDEAMTQRAGMNAANNQVENVRFYAENLFEDVKQMAFYQDGPYDKVLLDPPRAGAEAIATHIKGLGARKIVYVSCNPATLARDAGIIVKQGYTLRHAGVMDMFPHTAHVESIAVFEQGN